VPAFIFYLPDHLRKQPPSYSTAPTVQGRRLLKDRDWGDSGDPTGTEVLSRSRIFPGGPGTPKRAATPEAAESTANSGFLGIWRREMTPSNSVAFATVESDPLFVNPDRKKGEQQTCLTPVRGWDSLTMHAVMMSMSLCNWAILSSCIMAPA
jgi:hypothetical protein